MYEDLYVMNGKVIALTLLLSGQQPSAEDCNVTPEDFTKICNELKNEGLISDVNDGTPLNAEVTEKVKDYINTMADKMNELL